MNCYIFDIHIDCCFVADTRWKDGTFFYCHDLVEVGPLDLIDSRIKNLTSLWINLKHR